MNFEKEAFQLTRKGMEEYLSQFKDMNAFMLDFRKRTGWTIALIRTDPKFVRFQLQSEPPESEDTGEIRCITEKDFIETALQSFKLFAAIREGRRGK